MCCYGTPRPASDVSAAKKTLDSADLQHGKKHQSAVDDIKVAVDVIGMQLADEVAIEMRSAFDHLEAAVRAADDQLRLDDLGHARQLFTRMANRPVGYVQGHVRRPVVRRGVSARPLRELPLLPASW